MRSYLKTNIFNILFFTRNIVLSNLRVAILITRVYKKRKAAQQSTTLTPIAIARTAH